MTGPSETGSSLGNRQPSISATVTVSSPRDLTTKQRDLAVRLSQATIADAIGLLLRSERHRHYSLADLEWLLLPPLLLKQIMLSYVRPQVTEKGDALTPPPDEAGAISDLPPMAVAMVTWALVSPEVNAKLDAQLQSGNPYRLAPQEWKCGDIPRLVEALGQPEAVKETLTKLKARLPQLVVREG